MADIDSLIIQISTDATKAEKGLETLSTTLGKLRDATKGGLGLSSIANQVKKLSDSANGVNSTTISNLKGLAEGMKKLSEIGDLKISSSIANQITKINTALSGLNVGNGANKISELVSALKPLETLGKSSLSSTTNALNRLPEALQKLDTRQLYTQIQSLTRIMQPLATEMDKIAKGFNAFPSRIQKLIQNNEKLGNSNNRLSTSYINLWAKLRMAYNGIKMAAKTIAGFIDKSNDYIENVNLFNVSMGEYAGEARAYAEEVGELMGIDPGEWMRNQGVFMTLATGFGVAGDRANKMSKNLTQLGYDISSLFNMPYEDAMLKLQSGLAGELEPLRRIGYDLSVARLQQEAYTLGINKKVSAMTQAEKAELRYYAIMTQVTSSHKDMANTLDQPANQLRVLKSQIDQAGRAIGNIFIPLLKAVLPYLIALAKAVRLVANEIAHFFGYTEDTANTNWGGLASGAEDYSEAIGGAADNAKKLQQYTMGFDELNVIDPNKGSSSDSGSGGVGGSGFDFELPEYDFMSEETQSKVNELVGKIKDDFSIILGLVGGIALGLLTWKFSKSFLDGLTAFTVALGLGILIDSIYCTFKEGLSWKSVIEGAVGGALIGAAIGFKLGGFQGALGGIIIGIGVSLVINGITGMLADGVQVEDVVSLISGVLATVGGIITVIKLFNKSHTSPLPDIETAGNTIGDTSVGTSKLFTKLTSFAKNLGMGVVILAEVALAAGIFVGAIWGLGVLLDETGKAWQPVIENGETIATAVGIGTGILLGIGLAAWLLGTVTVSSGGTIAVAIGVGAAMMLELGAVTALFLAEILVVGKLLDEIGDAWKPVLQNGEPVKKGIATGTTLLVAIGVVAAALGAATVASAGALPVAIGLGTAILVELALAFQLFCDSLVDVATKLSDDLAPALEDLNEILPGLETDMDSFTSFMDNFAKAVVAFTVTSAIAGIAATIDKVIGFFTDDPIKRMYDEVTDQTEEFEELIPALEKINPLIEKATELVGTYKTNMGSFESATGGSGGFLNSIVNGAKGVVNGLIELFQGMANGVIKAVNCIVDGLNSLKIDVPQWVTDKFGIKDFGFSIPRLKEVTITPLATGGLPETGQMFIAREAGPELVGNIGNKSAVVNNEQIVASVSRGVAEANNEQNSLLREQNTLLRALLEKEGNVYLDGKKVTASVEKHQRERGRTLLVGGAY